MTEATTRDVVLGEELGIRPPARKASTDGTGGRVRRRILRKKVKILFLSANPRDARQLDLPDEYRTIEQSIKLSKYRDLFELEAKLAVQLEDLPRALLEHRPDVVHFACHGSAAAELMLRKKDGGTARVPAEALAEFFRILHDNVVLVVLNACCASEQASAIRESVGLTIGMREPIEDAAAITFSETLYESLAFGRSVRESFELATTAILASGSVQATVPELFEGEGTDASAVCLVGERSHWPPWPIWVLAIAGVGGLVALAWRWSSGTVDERSDARPIAETLAADAPGDDAPIPDPVRDGMVRFTGARIRPGVFDRSQRPAACAALKPTEDCARSQDPREIPETTLDDFYLDKHEVTSRELAAWLEANPGAWHRNPRDPTVIQTPTEPSVFLVRASKECSLAFAEGRVRPGDEKANQPATCVSWMAARDYCRAEGKRLPLELEWEFAAKGAEGRAFPWGAAPPRHDGVAFHRRDSIGKHPVDAGTSAQDVTPQGVRDLGGNVAEWVADEHGNGKTATIRGGSWHSDDACHLLGSGCKRIDAESLSIDVGFRCASSVAQDKGGR